MSTLHIRLLVGDPLHADAMQLADALRGAGHLVITTDAAPVPGTVSPAPDFVITDGAAVPAPESLDAAEARHIAAVLRFTDGNRRDAAALLGVARSTLLAKLRRYGLA